MTRRLRHTAAARADLIEIARYIASESGDRATGKAFARKIDAHCRKLAGLPGVHGTARPELLPGIRSTPFHGYVIFFRYRGDVLEIVNVLNGHRDLQAHFDA